MIAAALVFLVVALYAGLLLSIRLRTAHEWVCPKCNRTAHLERLGRPEWMKKLAGFLPLKYIRCRFCQHTFFLPLDINNPLSNEMLEKGNY
ncbi:hypothetical protein BWI93_20495 [Siphonobacter sp. BAB-5385]|uniref:hypothetical protein n=1 Tax=unclassified Siphonobacter TaxID=2635712 RepID=UPI000B9EBB5D|nr:MULTISPECIES: hypothetical protein [unclassified Siphonobacter]OZI06204.1 hypothetical protein BWI93_20495 [Siphonobacter sp. BAB-5385]PMD93220.1 hypothetical protein BWI97_18555 [Siphonobacter sp. BAB-5405]